MYRRDVRCAEIGPEGLTKWMLEEEWAPCRHGCPVHADVRTYIEHAACGNWKAAIDVIREQLPFAAVCGRICHHPCEDGCRRSNVDEAVAIREVKRFVAETQGVDGSSLHDRKAPTGKKVAIIGAGPSGMSAALKLAESGHSPVVFERADVAGGIPATTIPRYRLPLEVTGIDTEWICRHGVQVRTGVEVGKDITIGRMLEEDGFCAVLIAAGLSSSRKLPIPGSDHRRVYAVMDFLQAAARGESPDIGSETVVIGAGNVAMDAARTAVRLGADQVKILCLEEDDEIPAYHWEVREAGEEGVRFIKRRGPVEIKIGADGEICGLTARKVTRVFDEEGIFAPEYDDSDTIVVSCDTVIFAIGQAPDAGFAEGSGLKLEGGGRLNWDTETCRTELERVFACGEIVTPPGSVVEACASGKRAAGAVDAFLSGEGIDIDGKLPYEIGELPEKNAENVIRRDRRPVPTQDPEQRRCSFDTFESNYEPDIAAMEARRCMNCGGGAEVLTDKCAACLTCVRVCPFDAPVVTDTARVASEGCQACGICEAECPANAIVLRRYDRGDLRKRIEGAISGGCDCIALIGGFCAPAAAWRGEYGVQGTAGIYLPSTASISVSDLLYAFELGARRVAVIAPGNGQDRYPQVTARTKRRVIQAQKLLKEAGLDDTRLKLEAAAGDVNALTEALQGLPC